MAKEKSYIVTNLYPIVEKNMKNPKVKQELNKVIAEYFDKNSDVIHDIGIANRIFFLNSDNEAIYLAAGLDPNEIKRVIKQSAYIGSTWQIMNEPLNTAAALIIRYLAKTNDKLLEPFIIYYSFYFYSSLHFKYIPYGANEDIMAYTINNLSYKFKIKETGSLYETIKAVVLKSNETYIKDLIKGEDKDIVDYVSAIKTRLNDVVKNIKNEYKINYENDNYLNSESDDYSEENYHVADNTSYAVKRITDSAVMKLMTYGADMNLAKFAARLSDVSINEIRNVIMHLSNNDAAEITRLIELILQLFLFEKGNTPNEVGDKKFLGKCMEIYKKSNTSDKIIIEIKTILDKWLNKYSASYRKTNREATISNFRKSIYVYFVLHIQSSAR